MDTTTTTTTKPAGKRARNGSVILTDRMCEKRVAKRLKSYERKCPGLYVKSSVFCNDWTASVEAIFTPLLTTSILPEEP